MSVLLSWARTTLASVDRNSDRVLVGVLVLLAFAIALLFLAT
jgi:hypothetical protein